MLNHQAPETSHEDAFAFGPFTLLRESRMLLRGDEPVELGGRAFDLLATLAGRPGEVIDKRELIASAWPRAFVEESNLRVQINTLRRALGDGRDGHRYVANVPGRGYGFVAQVRRVPPPGNGALAGRAAAPGLPAPLTDIIGRESTVALVAARLERCRLVSIVGPGGIGKTTVAVAVAHVHVRMTRQTGWFVDLGAVDSPDGLVAAIMSATAIASQDTPLEVALAGHRGLLVLDNCEHLVDAVAALCVRLQRGAPGLAILTTSRQPLRAEGEWIHRLAPLDLPPEGAPIDAGTALGFSALRLFVERASASTDGFQFRDDQAEIVAYLCRRVDGIPLGIEVIAARVGALGLRGLATCLDDRFLLLTQGQRTALPRHHTLRAALGWSVGLLRSVERRLLARLASLPAAFTLDAALVAAADAGLVSVDALGTLHALVEKSLVVAEERRDTMVYRLLQMTRAYAREELAAALEAPTPVASAPGS